MEARAWILALVVTATISCDSNRVQSMAGSPTPAASAGHVAHVTVEDARTGRLIIGEEEFPFQVELCSLGSGEGPLQFMLMGRGITADGRTFTVNADAGGNTAALVLRIRSTPNGVTRRYSARLDPAALTISDFTISGSGEFHGPEKPRSHGSFAARCARS